MGPPITLTTEYPAITDATIETGPSIRARKKKIYAITERDCMEARMKKSFKLWGNLPPEMEKNRYAMGRENMEFKRSIFFSLKFVDATLVKISDIPKQRAASKEKSILLSPKK